LAFPAPSIALTVADRAFEVFPYIATEAETTVAARGGSPVSSDGLPFTNPAHSNVSIAA
jgi:hypothetical protein